ARRPRIRCWACEGSPVLASPGASDAATQEGRYVVSTPARVGRRRRSLPLLQGAARKLRRYNTVRLASFAAAVRPLLRRAPDQRSAGDRHIVRAERIDDLAPGIEPALG